MIDFFEQYILPSSPARAKLSIHLHARGISGVSSPAETTTLPKVTDIVEKGINMLNLGTNSTKAVNGDDAPKSGTSTEPYLIENVREYKSRLAVTAGPQPVKDLSEFEDLDSKL